FVHKGRPDLHRHGIVGYGRPTDPRHRTAISACCAGPSAGAIAAFAVVVGLIHEDTVVAAWRNDRRLSHRGQGSNDESDQEQNRDAQLHIPSSFELAKKNTPVCAEAQGVSWTRSRRGHTGPGRRSAVVPSPRR